VGILAIIVTMGQAWSKGKSIADRTEAARQKLQTLEASVNDMNSKKACEVDSQCEVIEGGSRHCGGPSKIFVFSTANPKHYSQLKAKISEYTKAEEDLNKIDPPTSCTAVPEPVNAVCKEGQCRSAKL
jgi:hypothetical protein